jgi:hypothetical protein
MVLKVPNDRVWDVTVGGRIENVTDQDVFPDLFLEALVRAGEISVMQFNRPGWPHTISIVVRLTASRKEDAELQAQKLVLPVLLSVAKDLLGAGPFGWTLSVAANPASNVTS